MVEQEKLVEVRFQIKEPVFKLLKEYCEWAGYELENFLEFSVFSNLEAGIDYCRGTTPKAEEFWERVKEIRRRYF